MKKGQQIDAKSFFEKIKKPYHPNQVDIKYESWSRKTYIEN